MRFPIITICDLLLSSDAILGSVMLHVRAGIGAWQGGAPLRGVVTSGVRSVFDKTLCGVWRVLRRNARIETYYAGRVSGLRLIVTSNSVTWRGRCPMCGADAFLVFTHFGDWCCDVEGGCNNMGTAAALEQMLGASVETIQSVRARLNLPDPPPPAAADALIGRPE